jgi:hypothetical protein
MEAERSLFQIGWLILRNFCALPKLMVKLTVEWVEHSKPEMKHVHSRHDRQQRPRKVPTLL